MFPTNIDRMIYDLKQRYPREIVFHRDTEVIDALLLKKATTKVTRRIPKAIVLPENSKRQFIARLATLVANREFSYGMWFDQGTRTFIVDADDLGPFAPIQKNDYIVFDGRRWDIQECWQIENSGAWSLIGRQVAGVKVSAHIEKSFQAFVVVSDSAGITIQ